MLWGLHLVKSQGSQQAAGMRWGRAGVVPAPTLLDGLPEKRLLCPGLEEEALLRLRQRGREE